MPEEEDLLDGTIKHVNITLNAEGDVVVDAQTDNADATFTIPKEEIKANPGAFEALGQKLEKIQEDLEYVGVAMIPEEEVPQPKMGIDEEYDCKLFEEIDPAVKSNLGWNEYIADHKVNENVWVDSEAGIEEIKKYNEWAANAAKFANTAKFDMAFAKMALENIEKVKSIEGEEEVPVKKEVTSSVDHISSECLVYYPRNTVEGDYADNTIDMGQLQYTNIRDLVARFFLSAHYSYGRIPNWRGYCIGITSKIRTGRIPDENGPLSEIHMPMFDYDGKNIKTLIRKDVKLLQGKFGLGPAHVFKTKRGFHVIFMCDEVTREDFMDMLDTVKCCKGFKKCAKQRGRAVLRISAKYTEFDIEPEYVLQPKEKKVWRKLRKAHVIEAFHKMGQECGTHIAAAFPDWAHFAEDEKSWKPRTSRPPGGGKKLKKEATVKKATKKKPALKVKETAYNTTYSNVWVTTNSTTTSTGNW